MNTQPTTPTPSPADLLCKFVDQRPGMEPMNYGSWKDYRRESAEVTRDRRDFYELFIFALRKLGPEALDVAIEKNLKNTSGRLFMDESGKLGYHTGQYFATEYRPAACRVLVEILWHHTRESRPDLTTGHDLRAYFRREFSRRVASGYYR
jgi:hypothetical protein